MGEETHSDKYHDYTNFPLETIPEGETIIPNEYIDLALPGLTATALLVLTYFCRRFLTRHPVGEPIPAEAIIASFPKSKPREVLAALKELTMYNMIREEGSGFVLQKNLNLVDWQSLAARHEQNKKVHNLRRRRR